MFLTLALLFTAVTAESLFGDKYLEHFDQFKKKFHVRYRSHEEEAKRLEIFKQAMERVDEKNKINGAIAFGITKFSDRTPEEFSVLLGRKNKGTTPKLTKVREPLMAPGGSIPSYSNWVEKGVVTPIKNQGQCGSCWAFSAAEQIESQWALNGNGLWEFSPQQIASCTASCDGCGGGEPYLAFEYINSTIGLASAWFAPYEQSMYLECLDSSCTESCSSLNISALMSLENAELAGPYAMVTGYEWAVEPCYGKCNKQNLNQLAANIATYGPASICVNAAEWQYYTGGVLTSAACGSNSYYDLDHAVQLVGYNYKANPPYWIVKNSWATNWGIDGYIYLEFNANTCGLADEAVFVALGNNQTMFEF